MGNEQSVCGCEPLRYTHTIEIDGPLSPVKQLLWDGRSYKHWSKHCRGRGYIASHIKKSDPIDGVSCFGKGNVLESEDTAQRSQIKWELQWFTKCCYYETEEYILVQETNTTKFYHSAQTQGCLQMLFFPFYCCVHAFNQAEFENFGKDCKHRVATKRRSFQYEDD